MKKKTTTLLITTLLFLTLTTAQITINEPEQDYVTNEAFDIIVDVDDEDIENVDFNISNGDENDVTENEVDVESGEASLDADDWTANDNWEDDEELTLTVEDNEGDTDDSITVHWDEVEPSIEHESLVIERDGDGSIDVGWDLDEGSSGYEDGDFEFFLYAREAGSDDDFEEVNTGSAGDNFRDDLTDDNNNRYYPEIEYVVSVEDEAGNTLEKEDITFGSLDEDYEDFAEIDDSIDDFNDVLVVEVLDESSPDIVSESPDGLINDDSPTVEIELEDELSGITSANMTWDLDDDFSDSYSGDPTSSVSLEIDDLSGLSDGTKDVNYEAEDDEGNTLDGSWSFTIDTAAPEPDVWLRDFEEGDVLTSTQSMDIAIDENDYESENVADGGDVECIIGNPDAGDYLDPVGPTSDPEDDIVYYDCGDIDPSIYDDGETEINVRFEDTAGNSGTTHLTDLVFDSEAPTIDEFELEGDYVNTPPRTYIEASNDGTEIQSAEYTFSSDVADGEGNEIDIEEGNEINFTFTPEMSSLSDSDYSIIVRVEDENEWSDNNSKDFTLDREAEPNASISVDDLMVEPGENSSTLSIDVENTGMVALSAAELTVNDTSNDITGESDTFNVEGNTISTENVDLSINESFGQYESDVYLQSSDQTVRETVNINIQGDENETDEVEQGVQNLESSIQELRDDIDYLREEEAEESIIEEAEGELELLESNLEDMKNATEEDEHYRAAGDLENIDGWSSMAAEASEEALNQHAENVRWFYIQLGGLSALALLSIVGGLVLWRSDYEVEVHPENLSADELSETVEAAKHKIQDLTGSDDNGNDNDDWNGFN